MATYGLSSLHKKMYSNCPVRLSANLFPLKFRHFSRIRRSLSCLISLFSFNPPHFNRFWMHHQLGIGIGIAVTALVLKAIKDCVELCGKLPPPQKKCPSPSENGDNLRDPMDLQLARDRRVAACKAQCVKSFGGLIPPL